MDALIRDIPEKLLAQIDKLAEKERRSRNQQMILMLEQAVEQAKV
jgi:hypothetical protein